MIKIVSQFKEWLRPSPNRRRAERYDSPETVAYYWDGSAPVPREIRDISLTGAYLQTPERWYPGTIVKLTLKVNQPGTDGPSESIEVRCRVVRHGADGVGLQFLSQELDARKGLQRFLTGVIANISGGKTPVETRTPRDS